MPRSPAEPRHLAPHKHGWKFVAAAPPREVFAVMEQMIGTPPYRYEVTGQDSARVIEVERKGFFGQWSKKVRHPRWVTCTAHLGETGTEIAVEASGGRGAVPRGLQLVQLLTRGSRDRRTIYRDRHFPDGPVTLVASWAGTPYQLYAEPRFSAARGDGVLTATPLVSLGHSGAFVKVRTGSGTVGWIERDELVPAPAVATREAQDATARYG